MNNFSKKSAADAISSLILFITIITISTGLVFFLQDYALESERSIDKKKEQILGKISSEVILIDSVYNSSEKNLRIVGKNIGDTTLETKYFSIFIDSIYMENLTYLDENGNLIKEILNPNEIFTISINQDYESGNYKMKLVSQFGNIFEYYIIID